MTIPFLKLPYLIQLEVFKQLRYQEIFLLSLCSKNFNLRIQRLQLSPQIVSYVLGTNEYQVFVRNNDMIPHLLVHMKNVSEHIDVDRHVLRNLGGKSLKCRHDISTRTSYSLDYFDSDGALESLQNHVNILFRNKPRVQLDTHFFHNSVINDVRDAIIQYEMLGRRELDAFMTAHPNLQNLKILSTLLMWDIPPEILNIEGLSVDQPNITVPMIIERFNGKYLILNNAQLERLTLMTLVMGWRKKMTHHNLRAVIVKTYDPIRDIRGLLRSLGVRRFDGLRRPRTFRFDSKLITLESNLSEEIDCSNYYDIQQDDGGKWASIRLTTNKVRFFVWD
ncbi:hypothetical protein GCK72_004150 [Caenorhabditis remanei]|uniref:F-box domain-containing protein n=1 Tax=Caenorhabditis remanei TaxID=31234 RepID=A0A6A5HCV6_CAERE|nr:hypothetical protein GCK72_004150 [Caenorhabditis remanei]KAF1764203.1 hypothetical protein GCK72_004150 [Caenorhabditis remanei]